MKNVGALILRGLLFWVAVCFLPVLIVTAKAQSDEEPAAMCQGTRWKPCVCWQDVPEEVSYRPSYPGCRGNAAVLLRGKYLDVFSVVVRDKENRDRWPRSGFNRCSFRLANSANPPARCSAFKVQKTYFEETAQGIQRVNCLGAKGTSLLFQKVVRITAKLADVPGSNADPLVRWCLQSPRVDLN